MTDTGPLGATADTPPRRRLSKEARREMAAGQIAAFLAANRAVTDHDLIVHPRLVNERAAAIAAARADGVTLPALADAIGVTRQAVQWMRDAGDPSAAAPPDRSADPVERVIAAHKALDEWQAERARLVAARADAIRRVVTAMGLDDGGTGRSHGSPYTTLADAVRADPDPRRPGEANMSRARIMQMLNG